MKRKMDQVLSTPGQKVVMAGVRLRIDNRGFGMNELLGIAAALIIAAVIIIPGLKIFAGKMMDGLNTWWSSKVASVIFPA